MSLAMEVPRPCSHDRGAGALARAAVAIARAGEGAGAPAGTFMVKGATKVHKGGASRWAPHRTRVPGHSPCGAGGYFAGAATPVIATRPSRRPSTGSLALRKSANASMSRIPVS
jgi:hypothetical protein